MLWTLCILLLYFWLVHALLFIDHRVNCCFPLGEDSLWIQQELCQLSTRVPELNQISSAVPLLTCAVWHWSLMMMLILCILVWIFGWCSLDWYSTCMWACMRAVCILSFLHGMLIGSIFIGFPRIRHMQMQWYWCSKLRSRLWTGTAQCKNCVSYSALW